ncbi:MAG: hypothetical protein JW744_01255 [Candidatus Diapherotrites archaeon]|uniref:Uncharacterized protein n=1 Tax=Candidatus Iainarchaeum sp. TaxID=3101447 RepID=A0A938YWR0_9ARCH|nr:hypothetical protein [Candidatus Diapherotrites archaeon]
MARILFIVNEHPNESFATSVAKETKKLLEKAGHEVIWRKFKPKDTMLGRVIRSSRKKKFSEKELERIYLEKADKKILSMVHECKPDATYNFHCTPDYEPAWEADSPADFLIATRKIGNTKKEMELVEIKAKYKFLPERIRGSVKRKTKSHNLKLQRYLLQNTSQKETREAGLHPENFAEEIAKTIERRARQGFKVKGLHTRKWISRKTPQAWLDIKKRMEAARKRRK